MKGVVFSAQNATNAEVLASILSLYVPVGSAVLDLTFSKGRFWAGSHVDRYQVWKNDLFSKEAEHHHDLRVAGEHFPHSKFSAVVLDPPYVVRGRDVESKTTVIRYGRGVQDQRRMTSSDFRDGRLDAVGLLYREGAEQARSLLKGGGVLILKTQDEIRSGRFVPKGLVHLQLDGYRLEDIFIVIPPSRPVWDPKWKNQQHARKNHSYFLVHRLERRS